MARLTLVWSVLLVLQLRIAQTRLDEAVTTAKKAAREEREALEKELMGELALMSRRHNEELAAVRKREEDAAALGTLTAQVPPRTCDPARLPPALHHVVDESCGSHHVHWAVPHGCDLFRRSMFVCLCVCVFVCVSVCLFVCLFVQVRSTAGALQHLQGQVSSEVEGASKLRAAQLDARERLLNDMEQRTREAQKRSEEECVRLQVMMQALESTVKEQREQVCFMCSPLSTPLSQSRHCCFPVHIMKHLTACACSSPSR